MLTNQDTTQRFTVEKSFIGDRTNENHVWRLAFHQDLDPSTYLGYQDTEEKGSLIFAFGLVNICE